MGRRFNQLGRSVADLLGLHRLQVERPLTPQDTEQSIGRIVGPDATGRIVIETPNGGRVTAGGDFGGATIPGSTVPIAPSGQRTIASSTTGCYCRPLAQIPFDDDLPFIGRIVGIAEEAIEESPGGQLVRVGGHVASPMPSAAYTPALYVSKTGKDKRYWISGGQTKNYWFDKSTGNLSTYEWPPNKQIFDLNWLGYGRWITGWEKRGDLQITDTTTVSEGGAITTTIREEACPALIHAINLNEVVDCTGTYLFKKTKIVETPTEAGAPPNPYEPPPQVPVCVPVCTPTGPAQPAEQYKIIAGTLWGSATVPAGATVPGPYLTQESLSPEGNLNDLFVKVCWASGLFGPPNQRFSFSHEELIAAYAKLNGPVTYDLKTKSSGGFSVNITIYGTRAPYTPENCVCPPPPAPAPSPTPTPTPEPTPAPTGVKVKESSEYRVLFSAVQMRPGLNRPYKWEETNYREAVDGVETIKTQSQTVDLWMPLVTNEAGTAVICVQVSGTSTAPTPPPLTVRYWWFAPGTDTPVELDRSIFEPIFFTTFAPQKQGTIQMERKPTPDLITPIGGDPYLARVRRPVVAEDPNPARQMARMTVDFWAVPTGANTTRKERVRSLKLSEGKDVLWYSYHPGKP